jgi:hypothetical protein
MSGDTPDRFETVAFVFRSSDLALLLSLFESEDIFVFTVGRWHASADLMVPLFLVLPVPPPRQIPCFVLNGATAPRREPCPA